MESIAEGLAQVLVQKLTYIPLDTRLLVGIAGIPASGKSTLAVLVASKTNQLLYESHRQSGSASTPDSALLNHSRAIIVGLDGWHLTRVQLDALPDPKLAHDRRGAHWTFDSHGYVSFIRKLREPVSPDAPTITAPSFDHALKDPTPHNITILPEHRIVIIEGLYTFLSLSPWDEAGKLLDERWLVKVDPTVASDRIVKRHVASGITKDLEEARWRSTENDTPNGLFLLSNSLEPTRYIESVDDPKYALQ
ncbi:P-loop containing nucleoside triphosphate hydrolase protein [Multifurca ochricompacta]|uniref:P-loop containing nucleoside triphosphate hydrolase protein n=1 Tax=Multifurca ochricompacta TaxID=376703 RepID=A0AAD4MCN1_9AGAM|nr:P-loop containing nucleoside triphosphate hydrolase protein [Multifurca ochricompacta]